MPPRREIAEQIRKLVVEDRKAGLSVRQIASKYRISKSAVGKIWTKFTVTGEVKNKKGRGRKRATSARDDTLIVRQVKVKPTISCREIQDTLLLNVSRKTIGRRIKEANFNSRSPRRKPYISAINKKKRLNFAKKFVNKPLSFWKRIVWSDESKFELFGHKSRRRVWRRPGTAFEERHTVKTVKFGGGSVMVWGCFSWHGIGNLVLVSGKMNADLYIDIINENLEESVVKMELEDGFVFQQDNDPKHTAKKSKRFFNHSGIELLEWPPQSPDLNPIEHLWAVLDGNVPAERRSKTATFFNVLEEVWTNIDEDVLKTLVESMPRRLQAVIQAKGGHTKY